MKLDKIIGLLCVTFNPWSNKKIKLEIYACIYCQHIRKIKKKTITITTICGYVHNYRKFSKSKVFLILCEQLY